MENVSYNYISNINFIIYEENLIYKDSFMFKYIAFHLKNILFFFFNRPEFNL